MKQSLIEWVMQCNIPRIHVSNLLKRLHDHANLTFLPTDSRTLLSTYRKKIDLVKMNPGYYQHFDLESGLKNILHNMKACRIAIPENLALLVNFDGLPLFESSTKEFWPILVKVQGDVCR